MEFLFTEFLVILGLAISGLLHLIIPLYVIKTKKQYPSNTLWLIAFVGGVIGWALCAIIAEENRGFTGLLQSGFWILVNYTILYRKCLEKPQENENTDNYNSNQDQ